MIRKKFRVVLILIVGVFLLVNPVKAEEITSMEETNTNNALETASQSIENNRIKYSSYVENFGWQKEVSEETISGTVGQAKKTEAIKIRLAEELQGDIQYITYVQSYGWEENWKINGEESGKRSEHKRLEAIKIRLAGEVVNQYDIYYRVHSQSYGWLGWAKNGETAGTIGLAKRLEAIEIKLVEKGTGEETGYSYVTNGNILSYQGHSQSYGWLPANQGNIIGVTREAKRLEGYRLMISAADYAGGIEYISSVENKGWESEWKRNNQLSGTVGEAKRLEQVKIRLTGDIAEHYDIYYRAHVQGFGWLGWAKNGEAAGVEDLALRLEAIEIKLVEKGTGEETGKSLEKKDATVYYESYSNANEPLGEVSEAEMSGTTGQSRGIKGFKARVETELLGDIQYKTFNKEDLWDNEWKKSNEIAGNLDDSREITAIKIELTEELEERYDIYYRVHLSYFGWLDWAKNGEIAGSNEFNIEAIEIKLYLKVDRSKNNLETEKYYIEKIPYQPVYYNQKDSRWAEISYGPKKMGATGCTPTSLAMAFSGILNKKVLPTDVADYLYNHTNEFNKKAAGSSGMAVIYASRFYGIKYTALKSEQEIKKALLRGTIVYGAMGDGRYGTTRWNHAIIFYDYDDGKTFVYDPLNENNNDWEYISRLWNERSKDDDDKLGGAFFYSLELF